VLFRSEAIAAFGEQFGPEQLLGGAELVRRRFFPFCDL